MYSVYIEVRIESLIDKIYELVSGVVTEEHFIELIEMQQKNHLVHLLLIIIKKHQKNNIIHWNTLIRID